MSLSINEAMCLQKSVRERASELKTLRDKVAVEKTTSYPWDNSGKEKREDVVVKYDVKLVDKKIVQLELFLFKLESAIKQANAITKLDIVADVDTLLAPLE